MATRRFEFSEGGSSKFWEITVTGNSYSVRYGKIGTVGQEKAKTFASDAAAQKDADKLIAEKTGKGYAEVATAAAAVAATGAIDEAELNELIAAVDASPAEDAPYLVLADWLSTQSHPWGTLIALQHAIKTAPNETKRKELTKQETQHLQNQGAPILGAELSRAGRPTRLTWNLGFVTEALIASPTKSPVLDKRLGDLFAQPCVRRLTHLTLHSEPDRFDTVRDWDASTDQIVNPWDAIYPLLEKAPQSLTSLAFGEAPPTGAAAYVELPKLHLVFKALPNLTRLQAQGTTYNGHIEAFEAPELTELTIRIAEADNNELDAVRNSKLPKLEKLSLWLGGGANVVLDSIYEADEWDEDNEDELRYPATYPASDLEKMEVYDTNSYITPEQFSAFLAGSFAPSLKHLGIQSASLNAADLAAICQGALIASLDVLDLSGGDISDATSQALLDNADRLKHLKKIDVSRNFISPARIKELQKTLPNLVSTQTRSGDSPEFIFRYVATME